MKGRLTRRQRDVLAFVADAIDHARYAPTVREIAKHFGFASHTSAEKHLVALQKKGFIRRQTGLARAIELTTGGGQESAHSDGSRGGIPIVGRVPAGSPALAVEDVEGHLSLEDCFGDLDGLFALRVRGDSMTGVGIDEGDFVVVRQQDRVSNGEIAVVYVGEDWEATVKRVFFTKSGVTLRPENDAYEATLIRRDDPHFRVAGKVVGVVKRL